MSACPLCWGLGCALREDKRGRLFEWPCPFECRPPIGPGVIRTHARETR